MRVSLYYTRFCRILPLFTHTFSINVLFWCRADLARRINRRATFAKSAFADYKTGHNARLQAQSRGKLPAQAGFADVAREFIRRATPVPRPLFYRPVRPAQRVAA